MFSHESHAQQWLRQLLGDRLQIAPAWLRLNPKDSEPELQPGQLQPTCPGAAHWHGLRLGLAAKATHWQFLWFSKSCRMNTTTVA